MAEEKEKADQSPEIGDEELGKAAGGGESNGTFFCWQCRTHLPLSQQSESNPDYCNYCYHRYISHDADPYQLLHAGVQSSLKQK